MRQERGLPDYRYVSIKLPLDVLDQLTTEAQRQERSVAREVVFRLKRSFENNSNPDQAEANTA